ncbi:hypothetical protein OROGR_008139 [Orobanche gracilis]
MGRKGEKYKKKEKSGHVKNNPVLLDFDDENTMNDEIDAFHKSRDVVPLTISDDTDDSDEDNEQPVLDFETRFDDEDEDIDDEDKAPKGLAAKIVRQPKYLRSKFGGVEDALLDDADEEDQERFVWPRKSDLYGADVHEPQSSDDQDAAEEEREVLKMQSKRAEVLSMEDFGLKDASQDDTDTEPTFEEILDHGIPPTKAFIDKEIKDEDGFTYEIVHKDLNALTKEEQMDIVKSSAPELIGLLFQLNDALEQLDRVTPLVDKIRGRERAKNGGMHYLEVKQHLLQSFCEAITFYLLLKSEGKPVRDHPVIDCLVEIKGLLDKGTSTHHFLWQRIRGRERAKNGGMHYLEVKQHLLQSFCEAITFYLLLKSEGKPVRDHPVIDCLVEIKGLLDKGTSTHHFLWQRVISGDDDIPKRDDIRERRRKHELRVLAGAGIESVDDVEDDTTNISIDGIADANEASDVDSDLDYYEQVKREHAAKLAAKSDKYSRTMEVASLPDTVIDGKRHITRQIEKNRGLTRSRKKQRKNPRTAYKMKHEKAQTRRKGQVQGIIKPTRPYGGEASGINPSISHSRRFTS